MKKLISLLLSLSLPAVLLSGCGKIGEIGGSSEIIEFEAQTWHLTFSGAERSAEGLAARRFADAVCDATNGAVTVELHPLDALTDGNALQGLESVMDGTNHLALYSSQICETVDPRLGVVSLPFLFDSEEDAAEKLSGDGGAALGEILQEYQLHCIGIGEEGFRCPTNSQREITAPGDLQGLTIRVADSPLIQKAYRLWGANCVTAAWPMVFTALRTGTYDGQEAPLVTADAASVQSVQKYLTRWNGVYSCLYFCMNQELYNSLSPALQEITDQCGREAMDYQREISRQQESDILSSWTKSKVLITELTREAAEEFREAAQPCYDWFIQEYSSELVDLFTES